MSNGGFLRSLQSRVAAIAIGPSTLRGKGTTGLARATRRFLAELDLRRFTLQHETQFAATLDDVTDELVRTAKLCDSTWGRARKSLNIFLRDTVYIVDLNREYVLAAIRPWLELPLDSHTATKLCEQPEGVNLPKWRSDGVKSLTSNVNSTYQQVATVVATRLNLARVDLDVLYWRGGNAGNDDS